jgi:RHS repeat-associated protein
MSFVLAGAAIVPSFSQSILISIDKPKNCIGGLVKVTVESFSGISGTIDNIQKREFVNNSWTTWANVSSTIQYNGQKYFWNTSISFNTEFRAREGVSGGTILSNIVSAALFSPRLLLNGQDQGLPTNSFNAGQNQKIYFDINLDGAASYTVTWYKNGIVQSPQQYSSSSCSTCNHAYSFVGSSNETWKANVFDAALGCGVFTNEITIIPLPHITLVTNLAVVSPEQTARIKVTSFAGFSYPFDVFEKRQFVNGVWSAWSTIGTAIAYDGNGYFWDEVIFLRTQFRVRKFIVNSWLESNVVEVRMHNSITEHMPIGLFSSEADVLSAPVEKVAKKRSYFDGVGRPTQTVLVQTSDSKRDVVDFNAYDGFGREAIQYLPYVSNETSGFLKSNPLTNLLDFYNSSNPHVAKDAMPFAESIYESSPLNRVLKQGSPGAAWQPNTSTYQSPTDRAIAYAYEFNTTGEVLLWTYTYPNATNPFGMVNAGTVATPTYYAANQLYKNKTKDEQRNEVITYVDKEGRTVLKRVQAVAGASIINDTNYASTYYIYDDFGNLVCVIPPEATKLITQTTPVSEYLGQLDASKNLFLTRWAFRYTYDGRKRMTMKQVPGAEPVYMVYDNRDRLVLTQDGNQRATATKYWSFTKYDVVNRPIATGIKDTAVALTQAQMQTVVNLHYAKTWAKWGESYIGNGAGNVHGYSNKSYPVVTNVALVDANSYLTVTYYDRYDVRSLWQGNYGYVNDGLSQTVNSYPYNQPLTEQAGVIGLVTASKIKVLDGGTTGGFTWLKNITYYDDKYRVIQTQSDNYKGGIDRTSTLYDFVGKALQTKTIHQERDVLWKDLVGAEVIGNKLTRTATTTAGAASILQLPMAQNGWLEFTVSETNTNRYIGFNDTNPDVNSTNIDYAFYLNGTSLKIVENNVTKLTATGALVPGEVLKIERAGTAIKYYRNGVQLSYTNNSAITAALLVDASLQSTNATLLDVRTSFTTNTRSVTRRFDYDHAQRLINTWHKVDAQNEILLIHNDYNELGQLIDKKLHVSSPSGGGQVGAQSVDYRYNIRGWLTSINNARLANEPITNDDTGDYFGMELGYNDPLGTGNTDLYNGNISAVKWSNNLGLSVVKQNAYNYSYDALNRISSSSFKENASADPLLNWAATTNNAFAETGFDYDLNGNIKALNRNDKRATGLMDQLVYDYGAVGSTGNVLRKVTDNGDDTKGFKEVINSTTDDYTYDANGNLVWDRNKGGEEILKNPSFDQGSTDWVLTNAGRLTFANGQVDIIAGAASSTLQQNGILKIGATYVVVVDLVHTSGSGVVTVNVGGTAQNITTTGIKTLTLTAVNSTDFKLIPNNTFAGSIKSVTVKALTAISYNYLNLPEVVAMGKDGYIRYIYTASGQKLSQQTTQKIKFKQVDYVGEYIYQNDTLQFINHEEGRIIPSPLSSGEGAGGEVEYQYHLKDHLGNVRTTFTTKVTVDAPVATMETANANAEQSEFINYNEAITVNHVLFDHTNQGTTFYATRLTGANTNAKYGLAKSISVMPGDVITTEVFAKYLDQTSANRTAALNSFISAINGGSPPVGSIVDGGAAGSIGAGTFPFVGVHTRSNDTGLGPKAYLNYIVFDRNFGYINGGFRRLSATPRETGTDVAHERLAFEGTEKIEITEPGYVYIYLSNENDTPVEVYFDDFKVTHTKSPVIQSDDYYPFGLAFNSYSRENSTLNDYKYNGKEEQTELGLGWLDYGWRQYDPAIGRFTSIDPAAGLMRRFSPYAYAFDNPVRFTDPDGMIPFDGVERREDFDKDKYDFNFGSGGAPIDSDRGFCKDCDDSDKTFFRSNTHRDYIADNGGSKDKGKKKEKDPDKGKKSRAGEIMAAGVTAAVITSQLDSPLPGPADVIALGELATFALIAGTVGIIDTYFGDNAIVLNSDSKEPKADELIPGSLKRSPSYHEDYGNMTKEEINKEAKKGDPKAKQMKKLLDQAPRLLDKNKNK